MVCNGIFCGGQLSKYMATINGKNAFMGDYITANIGAPPRNGIFWLKKVWNFRTQGHFQPSTKKPLDYIHCKIFLSKLNNPVCDSAPSPKEYSLSVLLMVRCVFDNLVLFP